MKAKIIIYTSLIMCITTMFSFNAYAEPPAHEVIASVDRAEAIQAEQAIEEYSDNIESGVVYSPIENEVSKEIFDTSGYDMNKSYKVYDLYGLIIDEYKENTNFESLIPNEYKICVPADNILITLEENAQSNGYEVIGTETIDEESYIDMKMENETVCKMISDTGEKITDNKNLHSWVYDMYFVYVKTTQNEYIVPYFSGLVDEAIAGRIEKCKLYKADELISAMNNTFDIESFDPNSEGGINFKPLKSTENNITTEISVTKPNNKYDNGIIKLVLLFLPIVIILPVVITIVIKRR